MKATKSPDHPVQEERTRENAGRWEGGLQDKRCRESRTVSPTHTFPLSATVNAPVLSHNPTDPLTGKRSEQRWPCVLASHLLGPNRISKRTPYWISSEGYSRRTPNLQLCQELTRLPQDQAHHRVEVKLHILEGFKGVDVPQYLLGRFFYNPPAMFIPQTNYTRKS